MNSSASDIPFADLALARKLERTEASTNAAFVEARARLHPESGATWIDVGGAYAMFDGVGSPMTQTFGLGVFSEVSDNDFEAIESFFTDRGSDVFHEVSPMTGGELLASLVRRGYRPVELSSVLYRPVGEVSAPVNGELKVRVTGREEAALWADTAAAGWSTEAPELGDFIREL